MATRLRAAELEVLFTANTDDVPRAEKVIKTAKDKVEKNPITQKVDADTRTAVDRMKDVEQAQKRIVSFKTLTTVDANITRAEKNFARLFERVDYLRSVQPELQVDADVARAEKQMDRARKQLEGLRGARAVMEVDADTKPLEDATDGVGEEAGDKVGGDLEAGLIAALTAIPVAGGIILAGKAIGGALIGGIQAGMAVDARQDRLQALAGLSEPDARRFGFAAGEAYANTFGESIESNMNTARLGVQFDLLGTATSTRDAQMVVEGLAGIADVLEEDVQPVARTVATLLQSGIAKNASEAFDLLAAGEREGVNRGEDLLDTLTEFPALLKGLGLSGPQSLGLISQALKAGARSGDLAADALKEFGIRAKDASDSSVEGYKMLGLNAEDMTARVARGGSDAAGALDEVLRKLRETEDPVKRNAAAVALFGTQAEDLGDALFKMDLSTAVDQMGQVEGAARKMFDTLADNDQNRVQRAQRNVEVAMEGIQGALAAGFSEPIAQAADFISKNRGPVMQFFLDMANGALDFGATMVNAAADGSIAFGEFIAGPGADMIDTLIGIQKSINWFADTSELEGLRDGMRGADDATRATADTIRRDLLGGIEQARAKVNEFGGEAVAMGFLNDASLRLAGSIADIGQKADGTRLTLEGVDLANLRATESGAALDGQLRSAVGALQDELTAAAAAGETQDELAARYDTTRQALEDSLLQMGLTQEQARALAEQYGAVPSLVPTTFEAHTQAAEAAAQAFTDKWSNKTITFQLLANARIGGGELPKSGPLLPELLPNARGNVLTPMSGSSATIVPPGTWRVVGDRMDVGELFAPLDGSPRSWALIQEGIRRMPGVMPMADGGIVTAAAAAAGAPSVSVGPIDASVVISPREAELRAIIIRVIREYNDTQFAKGGA